MLFSSSDLLGEGLGVLLLVGRVRRSTVPMLNLTSLIISRLTRKSVGCVADVRAAANTRLKKCRRKPRSSRGFAATMKLLLLPDYMVAVLGTGEGHLAG